ncbi:hypothetical protein ACSBR2_007746 [Camellia fascicularis]
MEASLQVWGNELNLSFNDFDGEVPVKGIFKNASAGNDFKALVYEFMVNGSLDGWLHPNIGEHMVDDVPLSLNLLQRLNIAIDVGSALDYLHHHCQTPIVHCDLKPSNVLLNSEMTAHL